MAASTVAGSAARPALRERVNLESLNQSRAGRALLGLVVVLLGAGLIFLILQLFTGKFTAAVRVNAELSGQGNAVQVGSPVEYRNVTVGKVLTERPGSGGRIELELEIYSDKLADVPRGVRASVAPLSIFGNQYVALSPPAAATAGHIEAGASIPADTSAPSDSLQGSVSQLYALLHAVHPADLDTALHAFATALRGEGKALGHTFDAGQHYLSGIVPNLGSLNSDISLLAPVNQDLAASAPNLVGILGNSAQAAPTVTNYARQLHQFLAGGASVANQSATLAQGVYATYPMLVNEDSALLRDISANPHELSQTLTGLGHWASAWAAAENDQGHFISLHSNLPVADINAAVNAALGYQPQSQIALGLGSAVNPPTYTAADCPQYPGESNPYCGGGSPAAQPASSGQASTTSASSASPNSASPNSASPSSASPAAGYAYPSVPGATTGAQSSPSPAEQAALDSIASGLDGGSASPGVTSLLIYALLASVSPHP